MTKDSELNGRKHAPNLIYRTLPNFQRIYYLSSAYNLSYIMVTRPGHLYV